MNISVLGAKKEDISLKELRYFTRWASELLMGEELASDVDLVLKFLPIESEGLCDILDDADLPRIFLITLKKGNLRDDILENLSHELVHIKQFASGELQNFDVNNRPIYKNVEYDENNMEYWDYPWEIEAFGRTPGILKRYEIHLEQNQITF